MCDLVEVVREHLAAVAAYDWDRVRTSVSADADLTLNGVTDWQWTIFTLYRNVTEAWEFRVADTQIDVESDGVVAGVIRLVNHGWVKDVGCKYHVSENRIIAVTLSDAAPMKASKRTV